MIELIKKYQTVVISILLLLWLLNIHSDMNLKDNIHNTIEKYILIVSLFEGIIYFGAICLSFIIGSSGIQILFPKLLLYISLPFIYLGILRIFSIEAIFISLDNKNFVSILFVIAFLCLFIILITLIYYIKSLFSND
jgi:hypothetical protein